MALGCFGNRGLAPLPGTPIKMGRGEPVSEASSTQLKRDDTKASAPTRHRAPRAPPTGLRATQSGCYRTATQQTPAPDSKAAVRGYQKHVWNRAAGG